MVTKIPSVRVSRNEAQQGFLVTCSCGWRITRDLRIDADLAANQHRASHNTPNPDDLVA